MPAGLLGEISGGSTGSMWSCPRFIGIGILVSVCSMGLSLGCMGSLPGRKSERYKRHVHNDIHV